MVANRIKYIEGDVTEPVPNTDDELMIIVHCCNDIYVMGGGVAGVLRKKWPKVFTSYSELEMPLGRYNLIRVEDGLFVCNLIGQHGIGLDDEGNPPVRYDAIWKGLDNLRKQLSVRSPNAKPVSIHMPRMGAGLAGGDWRIIEAIVISTLVDKGIPVTVYDLPSK